jgi:hypothetical protein
MRPAAAQRHPLCHPECLRDVPPTIVSRIAPVFLIR